MKKSYTHIVSSILLTVFGGISFASAQQTASSDSIKLIELEGVQVVAVRAAKQAPVTKIELNKKQIAEINTGVDIPYLLSLTPGVIATSEAGTGVGYTSLRLRGADASRINFTINGVPLSDSESQQVFWVNMPDFASSLESLQIQRGIGTSSNGAGAFGGTINMQTNSFGYKTGGEFNLGIGSYSHVRSNIKFSSGRIADHFAIDARLSTQKNEGYIDRSGVFLNSYYLQAGYFTGNSMLKFVTFGGKERTGIAWNGISPSDIDKYGRRFNSAGLMYRDANGTPHYYRNTDNYSQRHYQLIFTHGFSSSLTMNITGHLTRGIGHTDEYRTGRKLLEYNLKNYTDANGKEVKKTSLIREKYLDNYFYGAIGNLNWQTKGFKLNLGLSGNRYDNKHYGKLTFVKDYPLPLTLPFEYYRNDADKTEASAFLKADWLIAGSLGMYGDVQYRYIRQTMEGPTDRYDSKNKRMQILDFDKTFNFFNPKFGLYFDINRNHSLYASIAMASREPNRKAYTEAGNLPEPKKESMIDYEAGYKIRYRNFNAALNFYYMDYKDQLVLDGRQSDVGEALTSNVDKSYRTGAELSMTYALCRFFRWDVAAAYSKNKIKEYTQYAEVYGPGKEDYTIDRHVYKDTDISFSPSFVATNVFTFMLNDLSLAWTTQHVDKQYLDNTQSNERSMPAYTVHNARIAYDFKGLGLEKMTLGVEIRNVLNKDYYSNAGAGFAYSKDTGGKLTENSWKWVYPQAPINFMVNLNVVF